MTTKIMMITMDQFHFNYILLPKLQIADIYNYLLVGILFGWQNVRTYC